MEELGSVEFATAAVWTLRILLPIILFFAYFKLQSSKDIAPLEAATPAIPRGIMMAHRSTTFALLSHEPGDGRRVLPTTKGTSELPAEFVSPSKNTKEKQKRPNQEKQPEDRDAPSAPDAAVSASRSSGHGRQNKTRRQLESGVPGEEDLEAKGKAQMESFINFVAFNRAQQRRMFLVDEAGIQPPPPPRPRHLRRQGASGVTVDWPRKQLELSHTAEGQNDSEHANREAQMVLHGAMNFKQVGVAKALYDKLADAEVDISQATFTLMVEASIHVRDLKGASDLLMKMETAGFSADSKLLSRVMDLYSELKSQRKQAKQDPVQSEAQGSSHSLERPQLSTKAPTFLPACGVPSPPFLPPPPAQVPFLCVPAVAELERGCVSQQGGMASPPAQRLCSLRTKLVSTARPFTPRHIPGLLVPPPITPCMGV